MGCVVWGFGTAGAAGANIWCSIISVQIGFSILLKPERSWNRVDLSFLAKEELSRSATDNLNNIEVAKSSNNLLTAEVGGCQVFYPVHLIFKTCL